MQSCVGVCRSILNRDIAHPVRNRFPRLVEFVDLLVGRIHDQVGVVVGLVVVVVVVVVVVAGAVG